MSRTRIIVGVVALIAILCVGAYVIVDVNSKKADELFGQVANHPQVIEELGKLEACSYDYFGSLTRGGKRVDVYFVRGPHGEGEIVTRELLFATRSIILRTDNGEWELME